MVCVCVYVHHSFIQQTKSMCVCVCVLYSRHWPILLLLYIHGWIKFRNINFFHTHTPPRKKSPSFSFSISFTIDFYFSTRQNDEYSNCFFLALFLLHPIFVLWCRWSFFFIYFFSENRLDSALQNVFHDCRWWRWCIDAVCVGVSMMMLMMEQKLSFKRVLGLIDMT